MSFYSMFGLSDFETGIVHIIADCWAYAKSNGILRFFLDFDNIMYYNISGAQLLELVLWKSKCRDLRWEDILTEIKKKESLV